jgi:pimeloyl-ACP methyl ester carboxylesterase
VLTEIDLDRPDQRRLHVYDTGGDGSPVFWHHGTPNVGAPPVPLFAAADRLGLRWVSHDRPGYGGSTRQPGRDLAAAAAEVAATADALGLDRFAVMGHSGGAMHALACAALLPDRVIAAVCVSGLAPLTAEGVDWFAGMVTTGAGELRAAMAGQPALEAELAASEYSPEMFTPADHAALDGAWSWLGDVAGQAIAAGPDGMVDDDLAYVADWGFDPASITAPVLVLHGGQDRIAPRAHGEWLARQIPGAELWLRPDDGHVSVLSSAEVALEWVHRKGEGRLRGEHRRSAGT